MNEIEFQNLIETSWQRELTPSEGSALKTYLANNVEAQTLWEEESALNHYISKLPNVPVSTNFTARVLQAVERDAAQIARRNGGVVSWLKRNWIPRIAVASLFICAGVISVREYQEAKRTEIARDVAMVSGAATFPQRWLQDFDAINRLSQPPVDNELLAALE